MAANEFELNVTRAKALAEVAHSVQYHLQDMQARIAQYEGYLAEEMEKPEEERNIWQLEDYNDSLELYRIQADLWDGFVKTLKKKLIS